MGGTCHCDSVEGIIANRKYADNINEQIQDFWRKVGGGGGVNLR